MSLCMPPLTAERFGKAIRNALASNQTRSNPSALGSVRLVSSKRGGSSSRYLQRQRNDPFVKQRLNLGHSPRRRVSDGEGCTDDAVGPFAANTYISRSAFKLLQLDDKYKFLRAGRTIIDLGAAPGGWSQVVVERIARDRDRVGREHDAAVSPVFALDILPMASIEGVTCLQGDFLDPAIQARLRQKVAQTSGEASSESFVDVVVSDMMSNTSGNSIADTEASLSLCQAAYEFAARTLRPTSGEQSKHSPPNAAAASVLIMKYFMSHEAEQFRKQVLERSFLFVKSEKMEASRKASREQFWICIGWRSASV